MEFSFRGNSTVLGFCFSLAQGQTFLSCSPVENKTLTSAELYFSSGNRRTEKISFFPRACKTTVSSSAAALPARETHHLLKGVGQTISFELGPQFSPAKEQMTIHRCQCAKEKRSLPNFPSKKQMMKCRIIMGS